MSLARLRWLIVPCPDEAMTILPGLAFASATNSAKVRHGSWALTTSTVVPIDTRLRCVKSLIGSKGMLPYRNLLAQKMVAPPRKSV
jgi:hypothetical protein